MAHTATNTNGFEVKYNKAGFPTNPVEYELKPNQAFSQGALVYMPTGNAGEHRITPLTAAVTVNAANPIVGVMAEAFTTTTNPTSSKTFGRVYDNPFNVYKVSFDGQKDGTATASTVATQLKTGLSSTAANKLKGAMVYIYEGTAKGDIRTINTNTTAGVVTVAPSFSAIPTTTSKFIILAKGATSFDTSGYNVGAVGAKLSTRSALKVAVDAAPAVATGYLNVLAVDPANLTMDVMITPAKQSLLAGRTSA